MSNQIPINQISRDAFNPMGGATAQGDLTISHFKQKICDRIQNDIAPGPAYPRRWQICMPVLADICSGDYHQIRRHKQRFTKDDWHTAWYMSLDYRNNDLAGCVWLAWGLSMVEAFVPANAGEAAKSIYDCA